MQDYYRGLQKVEDRHKATSKAINSNSNETHGSDGSSDSGDDIFRDEYLAGHCDEVEDGSMDEQVTSIWEEDESDSNVSLSGASRVLSLTGTGSYIDASAFRLSGVAYDICLVSRLALTTMGTTEASKAIVLDSTRSCSNIFGLAFDPNGTGINIPALSFGGSVFNQGYYLTITEGSAGISKALLNNPTSASSSTTGALRCAGGAYFGSNCLFQTAITCTDLYGLCRTPNQYWITGLGTLTSLSTTGNINCGGILNGFLGYGNLTELGIGSVAASAEYLRITGNGRIRD
ncbi:hypothetical protein GQ600_8957 [Phytophthora cactorum]|nr:hypothetical protein GQ600_8957 [Phytophthora cactorum]